MKITSLIMMIFMILTVGGSFSGCFKQLTLAASPVPQEPAGFYINYGQGMESVETIFTKHPEARKALLDRPLLYGSDAEYYKEIRETAILFQNNKLIIGQRLTPSEQQLVGLIAAFGAPSVYGVEPPQPKKGERCSESTIQGVDKSNFKDGYTLFEYDLSLHTTTYIVYVGEDRLVFKR